MKLSSSEPPMLLTALLYFLKTIFIKKIIHSCMHNHANDFALKDMKKNVFLQQGYGAISQVKVHNTRAHQW